MELHISGTKVEMGHAAADHASRVINQAIRDSGDSHIILATGASQFEFLTSLVSREIDWAKVTAFHLDEYIGISITHPASFRKYLNERFVLKVPTLRKFNEIEGENANPAAECRRVSNLIQSVKIDLACIGIGENGHVAFNDPPADFDTEEPYIVVELDEACRNQQVGEGWFPTFEDVPEIAISMSVRQILKAPCIVCTVPDKRKAEAVKNTLEGEVTNLVPASILQQHPDCHLYADESAVSFLSSRE